MYEREVLDSTRLIAAIRTFIDSCNDRCEPFVWTKDADEVLAHCKPKKTWLRFHLRPLEVRLR